MAVLSNNALLSESMVSKELPARQANPAGSIICTEYRSRIKSQWQDSSIKS